MQIQAISFLPLFLLFSTASSSAIPQVEVAAAALTRASLSERAAPATVTILPLTKNDLWVEGPCILDDPISPIKFLSVDNFTSPLSPNSCTDACNAPQSGFRFAVLSFGTGCACSRTDPKLDSTVVEDSKCSSSCPDSAAGLSCGGPKAAVVYNFIGDLISQRPDSQEKRRSLWV